MQDDITFRFADCNDRKIKISAKKEEKIMKKITIVGAALLVALLAGCGDETVTENANSDIQEETVSETENDFEDEVISIEMSTSIEPKS